MKMFVSYRRKANVQRAMNLTAVLRANFGEENVFLDTGDIEIGNSFPDVLKSKIDEAHTLIALISPEWLSSLDDSYRRRINSPQDWVHIEIATSLKRGINIVPVYVGDAQKLVLEQLPESLRPLGTLQGYELRDDHHWNDDVIALVSRLKGREIPASEIRWPRNIPKYVPDTVSISKIQAVMASLPEWELREFEVEDGQFKGQRGNELKRTFQFHRLTDAIDFMTETKDFIHSFQHHPRWENVFRDVCVRLSRWDAGFKITDRDFVLAKYLNRAFDRYRKAISDRKSDNAAPMRK